jgi:hypothetical protein
MEIRPAGPGAFRQGDGREEVTTRTPAREDECILEVQRGSRHDLSTISGSRPNLPEGSGIAQLSDVETYPETGGIPGKNDGTYWGIGGIKRETSG